MEQPNILPAAGAKPAAKQPVIDTTLLKALATLLICNSHLEAFYRWHWLAADGLLGNAIFFMLAGLGLTLSESRQSRPFPEWYRRRVSRIYPALWIAVAAGILIHGSYRTWPPVEYLTHLMYPTEYGFIGAIMVLYVLLYLLFRLRNPRVFPLALLLTMAPFFLIYWPDLRGVPADAPLSLGTRSPWLWGIFYFQAMLLGCWLAARKEQPEARLALDGAVLAALLAAYLGLKLYMVKGHYGHYYFLLNWLVLGILAVGYRVGTSPAAVRLYRASPLLAGLVTLLGSLTLELYLTHEYLAHDTPIYRLPCPLNLIVFFALAVPIAWVLWWIVNEAGNRGRRAPNQARSL